MIFAGKVDVDNELPVLLEFIHVTKAAKAFLVLDDVSFQVAPGTVHALVGEAGAGKTTVMRILGGFIRSGDYTGQVLWKGHPLGLRSPADAMRLGITIVPRKLAILENCSVADNIALASWQLRKSFWVSRDGEAVLCQALLRDWSIDIDLDAPVRSLTPLQKRLLMIARGLAVNPKLIILDEPLAEVPGSHASAQLVRFVRRVAEHGLTCLYLTRRPEDAMRVANSITVLRDGVVAGTWRGPEFDEGAIAAALPGSRASLPNPATDDDAENGGMFGPLRAYFDRLMRPS
jgi:ABC-type sugar transport system ATPase subunit